MNSLWGNDLEGSVWFVSEMTYPRSMLQAVLSKGMLDFIIRMSYLISGKSTKRIGSGDAQVRAVPVLDRGHSDERVGLVSVVEEIRPGHHREFAVATC